MGQSQSTGSKTKTTEEMDLYLNKECTRISNFTQRGFPDGMCHGMCLDWVRRILSGKTTRYNKYDKNPEGAEKRKQLMFRTHGLRSQSLKETLGLQRQKLLVATQDLHSPTSDLNQILLEVNTLKAELIECMKIGAEHPVYWKTFAELWNASEKNKLGQKKQANFDAIQGAVFAKFADVDDWEAHFNNIVQNIPLGKCAIAIMHDSDSKTSSHAIAFYRSGATMIEFFDPNFGEFTIDLAKTGGVCDEIMRNTYPTYDQASKIDFS